MKAILVLELLKEGKLEILKELAGNEVIENNNKIGKFNASAFVKRFLKGDMKESLRGVFVKDNQTYLIDGYRAFRFNKVIEGFEIKPDIEKYVDIIDTTKSNSKFTVKLDRLAIELLVNTSKKIKKDMREPFIFECEGFKIGFNPEYLLDLCKAGITELTINDHCSPAYFKSEICDGVILPVRLK